MDTCDIIYILTPTQAPAVQFDSGQLLTSGWRAGFVACEISCNIIQRWRVDSPVIG
jgi:hypothetical protein